MAQARSQESTQDRPCASRLQRLRMVRATVADSIGSDVKLIDEVLDHSVGGGKGLRALVAHISTDWYGLSREKCNRIAAAMEMIHVASLLHDDIVDDAAVRRHKPSANYKFGPATAVLAGDFLYSRASQMLCEASNLELLAEIADATNQLAEGEVMQLANKDKATEERDYFEVIRCKTAVLFSASAITGPVAAGITSNIETMREYGLQLGLAFQIMDDCLDYAGKASDTGKNVGTDFSEGKVTLPLLRARNLASKKQLEQLDQAFANREAKASFQQAQEVIAQTETIESVKQDARTCVDKALAALDPLPDCDHKEMLVNFAQLSLRRKN